MLIFNYTGRVQHIYISILYTCLHLKKISDSQTNRSYDIRDFTVSFTNAGCNSQYFCMLTKQYTQPILLEINGDFNLEKALKSIKKYKCHTLIYTN